jgi:hypothetical protein
VYPGSEESNNFAGSDSNNCNINGSFNDQRQFSTAAIVSPGSSEDCNFGIVFEA